MKKLILLLVVTMVVITGCKSKEEKLTEKEWILSERFNVLSDSINKPKNIHYKKSEKAMTFKFNTDGTLDITDNNGAKSETISWKLSDDNKKIIANHDGNEDQWSFEFKNEKLNINIFHVMLNESYILVFMHEEDKWLDDDMIEMFNKDKDNVMK
jgi:hypothetical protein